MTNTQKRVLFLCTHNSARSQMAEGLLRHLDTQNRYESLSAGTEKTHIRPLAIEAMSELGVDIASTQYSKTLHLYLNTSESGERPVDIVITVCDAANDTCPFFPGQVKRLHWSFPDPSKAVGTKEEQLEVYREVRDKIKKRIEDELLGGSL
ncbi:hypothetical protein HK102_005464 [Quaeritorhiza haematococci]|nr:hypothetical protein HK102_005464 [Quaeritorhiza haematococci]